MSGSLVVETNGKPTPASKKGWVGAAIGMLVMGPVGALAGYFVGKKFFGEAQEQEELTTNRKVVREPTFWNAKAAEGYVKGSVYGVLGGAALFAAGIALEAVSIGTLSSIGAVLAAPIVLAGLGVMIFGGVFGLIKGGGDGKKEMAAEYTQAQSQQLSPELSVSRQRTTPQVEYPVPDRAQSHLQEQQARRSANNGISAPLPS